MTKEQSALLEVIRAFKAQDQTDLEATLNFVMAHADSIKRLQEKVTGLERVLDHISFVASEKRIPTS